MSRFVGEIERSRYLRAQLWEAYRAKYGLISQGASVSTMVEMLRLEETVRRMESRRAKLEFDGARLMWIEDGITRWQWRAVSGRAGYQHRQHQYLKDKGPLPEGFYVARQSELQRWEDYSPLNRSACILGALGIIKFSGAWPGCRFAWGDRRVWLRPRHDTATLGRANFSIHGGAVPGSAGCIDLTSQMPHFVDAFIKYGKDMDVLVRY
ncbi:DUF2778 domain-containing protein [Cupriavidus sp. BIS7]|uniref:DUF2778 domain-containing protein n=1 Tax=Cupriavidus sp. BIS7 TaxID=1217718 RepID=UPI000379D2FE|nr:DUF2778 domain-containing protein [Cupriavidus sp. BIS7]